MAHHHFFVEAQANYGALLASRQDKVDVSVPVNQQKEKAKKIINTFHSVSFDAPIKHKTLKIAVNVLASLCLLVALQTKGWDGQVYYRGYSASSEALRCGILLLSLLLMYQLYDRNRFIMGVALYKAERERAQRLHEKRKKERKKIKEKLRRKVPKSQNPAKVGPPPQLPKITKPKILQEVDPWKVKLKFPPPMHVLLHESYLLVPSMLFCLVLPYPGVQYFQRDPEVGQNFSRWMDDEVGLLMFFRLAVFIWILREHSVLWVNRHALVTQAAKYTSLRMAPKFDTWFAIKAIYLGQPAKFIGVLFFSQWVVLSYVIWILEREENTNGLIEFRNCVVLAGMVILFTWPDDAWGVISVQTEAGKFASSIGVCTGLLVLTLVLGIAANQLIPTPFEKNALNFCNLQASKRKELDAAARLIQFVWRARSNWNRIMEEEARELRAAREADRMGQRTKLLGWSCGGEKDLPRSRGSSKALIEDEEEDWEEEDEGDEGDEEAEAQEENKKKKREPGFREALVKKKYEKVWAQDEIKWQEGLFKLIQNFQRWRRIRAELGAGVEKLEAPTTTTAKVSSTLAEKPLAVSPELQRQIDHLIQDAVKTAISRALAPGNGIHVASPSSSSPPSPTKPSLVAMNSISDAPLDPSVEMARPRTKSSPQEAPRLERRPSGGRGARLSELEEPEEEKGLRMRRQATYSTNDESDYSLSSDLECESSSR